MKRIFVTLLIIFSVFVNAEEQSFSDWMKPEDLKNYISILQESKYQSKDIIINTIQGRSIDGIDKYRVIMMKKPSFITSWWWWYGQDINSFTKKMKEYDAKGAELSYAQSFIKPDKRQLYQGVWVIYASN